MRRLLLTVIGCVVLAGVASAEKPTIWGTPVTKTARGGSTGGAGSTLWAPTSGNRIVLYGCLFNTTGAASVGLKMSGTGGYVVPMTGLASGGSLNVGSTSFPVWRGDADQSLLWESTVAAGGAAVVVCWGYEEQGGV